MGSGIFWQKNGLGEKGVDSVDIVKENIEK